MKLAKESKIFMIALAIIITSLFHLTVTKGQMGTHMIHRELFFIPIILSCFWFGLNYGLLTFSIVSVLYLAPAFFVPGSEFPLTPALFQIMTFLIVAVILGTLVNQNNKAHAENIRKKELAALGNAALNIGTEIQDVLAALKKAYFNLNDDSFKKDEIEEGFSRLDNLIRVLTSFVTKGNMQKINIDMNRLVREQILALEEKAGSAGILIETILDEKSCPSMVPEESIVKLIRDLISNAIEASFSGGKILIRTSHRATYNILEVKDEGTGIKPEHIKKVFRPFFTTKESGHGLSLASNYKFIQGCGGDIAVSSNFGSGTLFKVKIPIDDPSRPINSMDKISDWNPKDDGHSFKE